MLDLFKGNAHNVPPASPPTTIRKIRADTLQML